MLQAIHISLDLLLQDSVVQDRGLVLIIDWSQFSFRQVCRHFYLIFFIYFFIFLMDW